MGELAVAVAIQRACAPGPKRDLGEFLDANVPRVSCLPGSAFTGQVFHRVAQQVSEEALESAQVAIARAAVSRFELSTDVLAFDTTNFDTHIATLSAGELARRGHAKSKRSDLRVVGLGLLVSETGHVPLLYRSYPGNGSDQSVLEACLNGLTQLHEALDEGEGRCKAGATHAGARWRVLECAAGARPGQRRLRQPDLVAARTQGGGAGVADGRAAGGHEGAVG